MVFALAWANSQFGFGQSGKNLADDKPSPNINPRLTEHSKKMTQRVYRVTDNVYCAVGYGLANVTMITGRDGVIIIDAMESVEAAQAAFAELRKVSDKPVKAVIYTHNHSDHTLGVKAFVSEDDIKAGRAEIYAHESLMATVISNASVIAPALGLRSAYSFGVMLD